MPTTVKTEYALVTEPDVIMVVSTGNTETYVKMSVPRISALGIIVTVLPVDVIAVHKENMEVTVRKIVLQHAKNVIEILALVYIQV